MKKYLLFAATAAMMLASCSSEVDFTQESLQQANAENAATPVQFGTYLGKTAITRAIGDVYSGGTITTTGLQEMNQGFGVFAYYTGADNCYTETSAWQGGAPDFMYNQQVRYNNGTTSYNYWYYTPVKYWPNEFGERYGDVDESQGAGEETDATNDAATANGGKVSFFAYAPFVAVPSYSATPATDLGKPSAFATTAITEDISGTATPKGVVAITSNVYTGEPEVKYVLGSNASSYTGNAVDLLWGMRQSGTQYSLADGTTDTQGATADIYNTDLTKQTVDETVDFYFKHALAKIGGHVAETSTGSGNQQTGIQIILDIDNNTNGEPSTVITGGPKGSETLVTVSSITIQDLATYNASAGTGHTRSGNELVNVGWFNIANGTWSNTGIDNSLAKSTFITTVPQDNTNEATTGTLNAQIAEQTVSSSNTLSYTSSKWSFGSTEITGVTTTAQDVYTAASNAPGILLIPSTNLAQTFVVTITYTVRTFDAQIATVENETTNTKVVQTITNQVTIPANSLAANKYYKLLIHLGLTSVKFSATVSDWTIPGDTNGDGTIGEGETEEKQEIWLPSNTLAVTTTP